ncbi:MAG: hypothetical protein KGI03_03525, partial [Patescibacteria group bacterium]|nr:hypothetical protein [Patescibacteria group bacterium]
MNSTVATWVAIALLIVAGLALAYYSMPASPAAAPPAGEQSNPFASGTPAALTLAGGTVSLSYPQGVYGLAVAGEPLLAHPYIPPCDSPFDYCIYRVGADYASTTFESAGIRISRRADLASQASCLSTPPAGYANAAPITVTNPSYAAGAFGPLSDAATGHESSGTVYPLWAGGSCTEFETRIGESQYANYPPGTIGEFTSSDRQLVEDELSAIMGTVAVGSTTVAWPAP